MPLKSFEFAGVFTAYTLDLRKLKNFLRLSGEYKNVVPIGLLCS